MSYQDSGNLRFDMLAALTELLRRTDDVIAAADRAKDQRQCLQAILDGQDDAVEAAE